MNVAATSAATSAATAAAARKAAQMRQEEEEMTAYQSDDMDGWEFKIVRANSRKFKSTGTIRQLCEEEAQAGWEMVEKFDDSRIRFKRRTKMRDRDQYLPAGSVDPYRTLVGTSETRIVVLVLGICAVFGVVMALFFNFSR
jgi:hypothetical protein